jgi:hypothetical protein
LISTISPQTKKLIDKFFMLTQQLLALTGLRGLSLVGLTLQESYVLREVAAAAAETLVLQVQVMQGVAAAVAVVVNQLCFFQLGCCLTLFMFPWALEGLVETRELLAVTA